MSNKVVPEIYRAVIDDVVSSVKVDFEEYGMEEEILMHLQQKWEAKLLETRVADFARAGSSSKSPSPTLESKPEPSSPPAGPSNSQSADMFPFPRQGQVQGSSAAMPGAPGVGAVGTNGFVNGGVQVPGGQQGEIRVKMDPDELMRLRGGAAEDGHKPEPNAAGLLPGDDVIDSDLDDSDDELRGDVDGGEDDNDVDIVFCVYDKVQRVKNKWKTVFKDGMIHLNGKDYLFAKCNGEFEW
ncbi:transcription initiation factor TFIIA large subunit [Cryptococcus deuterogattii R265]|nr:transcription initiation factor TFIIA large subunit [Cryptococcus deuterogattii R265]